jgi:Domain of unknown function (DUF6378)
MTIEETLAERGARYGDFTDHAHIAQTLQIHLQQSGGWHKLTFDKRQALTVIADKIARILTGDPEYPDNWHDIQGYAKLAEDRCKGQPETTGKIESAAFSPEFVDWSSKEGKTLYEKVVDRERSAEADRKHYNREQLQEMLEMLTHPQRLQNYWRSVEAEQMVQTGSRNRRPDYAGGFRVALENALEIAGKAGSSEVPYAAYTALLEAQKILNRKDK